MNYKRPIKVQYADEKDRLASEAEAEEYNEQFESEEDRNDDE